SYNTWTEKGGFSVASETGHVSFAASNSNSDGFSVANEDDGNSEDDGYKNTSFIINSGVRPSDLFDLNFTANYTDAEYDMDGYPAPLYLLADTDETTVTKTFIGRLEGTLHLLEDRWQTTFGTSLTEIDRDYPDSTWATTFKGEKTKYEIKNHFIFNSQQSFIIGAETETETAKADSNVDEDTTTNAIYLQDQLSIGSFDATVGVRYDRHDDFGNETTWRGATGYTFKTTGTRLKGAVGTGFKAPSIYQLYDSWYGNRDLDAETSLGYDIGIEQSLLDHSLILQATWFKNDIDDYIQWDPTGFQNAGDITTQGVETGLEIYPYVFIDLRFTYTYTDTE
ncbi:MAG: TonB-dependent receptor, partial [Desulfuromusa sp.]|nr:TonB-dependent receptor [Desulfuromusa sp.]